MTKYNSRKTEVDGFVFDSKREANRYSELKLLQRVGEIGSLELQPRFEVVINGQHICNYFADFRYVDFRPNGREVIEDVKGVKTPIYRLKKKLVEAVFEITIVEV